MPLVLVVAQALIIGLLLSSVIIAMEVFLVSLTSVRRLDSLRAAPDFVDH